MKKIILVLPVLFLLTFLFVFMSSAKDETCDKITESFEDGSYIIVEVSDPTENEYAGVFSRLFEFLQKIIEFITGNKNITKTKYAAYYDSKGVLLWTVFLEADFTYNGKSSVCKNVKAYEEMYDADWETVSADSYTVDNVAVADFSVQQTKLGVKLKTVNKHLTLTCDKNGNII